MFTKKNIYILVFIPREYEMYCENRYRLIGTNCISITVYFESESFRQIGFHSCNGRAVEFRATGLADSL